MRRYGGWRFLSSLAVLIVSCVVLISIVEQRYVAAQQESQRESVAERLGIIRSELERELSNNLSLLNGLAAFIAADPGFSEAEYQRYASVVRSRHPAIVNLAAAPDLVIRHIHPVAGNEAAMGLDYRESGEQWPEVQRVIEQRQVLVAGPVELVQGGMAFIGRAPVFVEDGAGGQRLWGIVAAPVAMDDVFAAAGLPEAAQGMEVAIRPGDAGLDGASFYGNADLFAPGAETITMPVAAGSMVWQMAGRPVQAAVASSGVALIRFSGVLLLMLLVFIAVMRQRQRLESAAMMTRIRGNEQFLRAVEQISAVGGWRLDRSLLFTSLSAHARALLGVPDEPLPVPLDRVGRQLDSASAGLLHQVFRDAVRQERPLDRELNLVSAAGDPVWLQLQGRWYGEDGNRTGQFTGAIRDITAEKMAEQTIEYQANYDALTGLPNRLLFHDRLGAALRKAMRNSTRMAVLFLDLDDFKSVNDNLGHRAGDQLLIDVGRRIRNCVRDSDSVARYSGDEFVVLLEDLLSVYDAARVCETIVQQMAAAFPVAGSEVYCGVSIGVSFCPEDGDVADTLVIKADQAMYAVKQSGKNGWQFYTASMQSESERRHRVHNDLIRALEQDVLEVWYQPVLDRAQGRFLGCEALVRWPREDGSFVSPEDFVAIAEERGLVGLVDRFVLERAMATMQEVNAALPEPVLLSVNVSPRVLRMRDAAARDWLALATEARVPLAVEITERVLIDDAAIVRPTLDTLVENGVELAIDDFGTGYAGLGYFSRFPVRVLKMDRSFIGGIGVSETDERLIEGILLMAERLRLDVIAEGVETEEQLQFLVQRGCHRYQGYHLARPMPAAQLLEFLQGQPPHYDFTGGQSLQTGSRQS